MKVTIDNITYDLNVDQALKLGLLKKERTFNLTLTENEAATLQVILRNVGGSPSQSSRGYADSIGRKLENFCDLVCERPLTLSDNNGIYFK